MESTARFDHIPVSARTLSVSQEEVLSIANSKCLRQTAKRIFSCRFNGIATATKYLLLKNCLTTADIRKSKPI